MQNTPKQRTLWLLAAVAAPAAHFSGCGWLTAGLTALAVLPLSLLPKSWERLAKPVAFLELLWLGTVAGYLLSGSGVYWPSDNALAVPLTILALAACTNAAAAPRIGAVLAFCMGLLAIPQAVSGAAHLNLGWLRPALGKPSAGLAVALLLPALPAAGKGKKGKSLLAAGILTLLAAALIQGVISPGAAGRLRDAFYQTSRTLGYLEPVTAVAVTLGWYAVSVFLLKSAEEIGTNCGLSQVATSLFTAGIAAAAVICQVQQYDWLIPGIGLILWIVIPFCAEMKNNAKKMKKGVDKWGGV